LANSRKFGVYNIGFSVDERVLLRAICRLSENEDPQYNFVEDENIDDDKLDIAIINGTSPELLQEFESWQMKHPSTPIILMTEQVVTGENIFVTPPPYDSETIKGMLDTVTVESFRYVPESDIEDELNDDASLLDAKGTDVFIQHAIDIMDTKGKSSETILVVDDSKAVRKMMELSLSVLGFNPEFAESVESAIDMLD